MEDMRLDYIAEIVDSIDPEQAFDDWINNTCLPVSIVNSAEIDAATILFRCDEGYYINSYNEFIANKLSTGEWLMIGNNYYISEEINLQYAIEFPEPSDFTGACGGNDR